MTSTHTAPPVTRRAHLQAPCSTVAASRAATNEERCTQRRQPDWMTSAPCVRRMSWYALRAAQPRQSAWPHGQQRKAGYEARTQQQACWACVLCVCALPVGGACKARLQRDHVVQRTHLHCGDVVQDHVVLLAHLVPPERGLDGGGGFLLPQLARQLASKHGPRVCLQAAMQTRRHRLTRISPCSAPSARRRRAR